MAGTYATGIVALVGLTLVWIGVQRAWRGVFPGPDEDALADRRGCHACACTEPCARAGSPEEDRG